MKLWPNNKPRRIYADAAAATPLSPTVEKELLRLLGLFGNPSALHKEAQAAQEVLAAAREEVARVLSAHADEIIFTAGGTEANNLAVMGVLAPLVRSGAKVRAVTSAIEHSSILEPLRALAREGLEVVELPVDTAGQIDLKILREALTPETVFVSIQTINSEIGTIQDIREIAKEVRRARKDRSPTMPLIFHTDASQAPLWLPLNVEKLGVDLLTLDAQKIMGLKGAGALYARRGVTLAPLIYGGGQESGRRSGTENVAFAGALARALTEAQEGLDARVAAVAHVRDALLNEITMRIPQVEVNGVLGEWRAANNLNIYVPNLNGDMATVAMDREGVAISTRSACDTDDESPSHVLSAIGRSSQAAKESIRITLLPTATTREATVIAEKLCEVAKRYSQK